ncbi:Regulator of nonsense transcripts 1 [Colletotrichum tanaceti]|uniref:Regulator of nonsense transcripts 1 n=1 Tax=Colletotrichum tanaceti TaxID=1306861 RepID=A0A4U6XNQ6_9PEZI|nr:Regulator of nonsense transcripts 1 [Colletotrichum tanaceti]TKW57405.1 Regulator of nonsense transcripts 1 [Colletotrichum tanaceti]
MLLSSWNAGYGPIDESPTIETSQPVPCALSFNIIAEENTGTDEDKHGLRDLEQPSKQEFARVHGDGTKVEMINEAFAVDQFNNTTRTRYAWVVAPIPGPYSLISSDLQKQWIVLVELPSTPERFFPAEGDTCKIAFLQDFELDGIPYNQGMLAAERVPNPYDDMPDKHPYSSHAVFTVTTEYFAHPITKERFHPLASIEIAQPIDISHPPTPLTLRNAVVCKLQVQSNPVTYEAELLALSILTGPKKESNVLPEATIGTFEYLLDFRKEPTFRVDLFKKLPHMDQPHKHPNAFLQAVYSRLDHDHKSVYEQLRQIPAGLALILGCPGAGKTALNTFIAAMAMSQPAMKPRGDGKQKRQPVKILYLLDVNYPCDDAASRVHHLLKDAGINKLVIRVRGCAREMKNSAKLHPQPQAAEEPDFTTGFLKQVRLFSGLQRVLRDDKRAPTLDEVAWDRYEADKTKHKALTTILDKLGQGATKTKRTARELRTCVAKLYFSVIREADFIATTPVGAAGYLSTMFRPDIVFLDEAAHARELTAMIPIALYSPHAFILTGDTRQTRPFVECANGSAKGVQENVYAKQLTISTMERADLAGALRSKLLISHRMYGNLQELASELFYDGLLMSGLPETERFPDTLCHLRRWLAEVTGGKECTVPRVLLCHRGSMEIREKSSFYNPVHEAFIQKRCYELLQDSNFRRVDQPDKPGRILIITPYKAALLRYGRFIKVLPSQFQGRLEVELRFKAMEVRTVDSAQGHEADFVFVDTVRTKSAGFLNDPKRLCVMLTRARVGEMVLMHEGMTKKPGVGRSVLEAEWTKRVYDYCRRNGQLHYIG